MSLSRLQLTGPLDSTTPNIVLREIALAHHLPPEATLSDIAQQPVPKLSTASFRQCARFVNTSGAWTPTTLAPALRFLLQFSYQQDILPQLPRGWQVGLQTPIQPYNINYCLLYAICRQHQITLTADTTASQLEQAVRWLIMDPQSLRILVLQQVEHAAWSQGQYANILMQHNNTMASNSIVPMSIENLTRIYDNFQDDSTRYSLILPTTRDQAIALAAIVYKYNITSAHNAIAEYLQLRGRTPYRPLDPIMAKWYEKAPGIYRLDHLFSPLFDSSYYGREGLQRLMQFTGQSIGNAYEYLQIEYLSATFYYGPLPEASNVTAIEREDISNYAPGELLCYGVREEGQLQTISVQELLDYFTYNDHLQNIFEPSQSLNSGQLRKLLTLLERPDLASSWYEQVLSFEVIHRHKQLSQTLRLLHARLNLIDEHTRELLTYSESVLPIFKALLELTLYMRGWPGPGQPYPISTNVPVDNNQQDVLITTAWNNYHSLQKQDIKAWDIVQELPLYLYRQPYYIQSKDRSQGLTIGERLQIIRLGPDGNNIESCVRMSSNWLLSSVHRYLTVIQKEEPFDIKEMRYIS